LSILNKLDVNKTFSFNFETLIDYLIETQTELSKIYKFI